MRPTEQSPLLQTVRGERPVTLAWVLSASLLAAGYLFGSSLDLWNPYMDSGMYVCFDAPTGCASPEPGVRVLGELVIFALLMLGGISAYIAAGLSLLRPPRASS